MRSLKRTVNIKKSQKLFSFIVAYMVSFLGLLNCINVILNEMGLHTTMDTIIGYGLLIGSIIAGFVAILARGQIKRDTLFASIVIYLVYLITYAIFPENRGYLFTKVSKIMENPFYVLVIYSIPGYIFVRYLETYEYLKKYLRFFSYLVVGCSVIVYFFIPDSSASQYMTLSYNMLLQLCFLLLFIPAKRKIIHYAFLVLGCFVVIVGGARGAFVALAVEFVLILFLKEYSRLKKFIWLSGLGCSAILFILFYKEIIEAVVNWMDLSGVESRTIEMLLNSQGDFTSGRGAVQSFLLENWTIFGKGIYGDRVMLKSSMLFDDTQVYSHNLFVEWIVDYGVIIGVLLSIGLLFLIVKSMKKAKMETRYYIMIFIPTGLIQLLFSGSYLNQCPSFYVLLGLCVNGLIQERKRKSHEGIANQYRIQPREYGEDCS